VLALGKGVSMGYQRKTLRKLSPEARKLAKLVNELDSVTRRLKSLVPIVQDLEIWEKAERQRQAYIKESPQAKCPDIEPFDLGEPASKGVDQC